MKMKITKLIAELEKTLLECGDIDIKVTDGQDLYAIERLTDMNEVSEYCDYVIPDINANGSESCIVIDLVD